MECPGTNSRTASEHEQETGGPNSACSCEHRARSRPLRPGLVPRPRQLLTGGKQDAGCKGALRGLRNSSARLQLFQNSKLERNHDHEAAPTRPFLERYIRSEQLVSVNLLLRR